MAAAVKTAMLHESHQLEWIPRYGWVCAPSSCSSKSHGLTRPYPLRQAYGAMGPSSSDSTAVRSRNSRHMALDTQVTQSMISMPTQVCLVPLLCVRGGRVVQPSCT